jgi:hypothetical protein
MSAVGLLGFDQQFAQHTNGLALDSVAVNQTQKRIIFAVPVGFGSVRITNIEWVSDAVLNDADGTILVTVSARDVTEGADDVLVNAEHRRRDSQRRCCTVYARCRNEREGIYPGRRRFHSHQRCQQQRRHRHQRPRFIFRDLRQHPARERRGGHQARAFLPAVNLTRI